MSCSSKITTQIQLKTDFAPRVPTYNVGRLQFFYHSPSSKLPIRDVLNEQKKGGKTEPHIEIGAENYWSDCIQVNNIRPLVTNGEKYLFLMTTCQNKSLTQYHDKRYVVGYIEHKGSGINVKDSNGDDVYYVKGPTYLFSFKDGYPYNKLIRSKKIDEHEARIILNHFEGRKNILRECISEIKRVDSKNMTCIRLRDGVNCKFSDECLRWKQP